MLLITVGSILGIISIITLRHFNSGMGGSLHDKRWYLRVGTLSFVLAIFAFTTYLKQSMDSAERINKKFEEIVENDNNSAKIDRSKIDNYDLLEQIRQKQSNIESLLIQSLKEQNKSKIPDYLISFVIGILSSVFVMKIEKISILRLLF